MLFPACTRLLYPGGDIVDGRAEKGFVSRGDPKAVWSENDGWRGVPRDENVGCVRCCRPRRLWGPVSSWGFSPRQSPHERDPQPIRRAHPPHRMPLGTAGIPCLDACRPRAHEGRPQASSGAQFSSEPAPVLTSWSRSLGMGWPSNRKGRHAKTSRPGRLALPRRGSMRQAFRATYGRRADGWLTGWPQSGCAQDVYSGATE